MGGMKIRRAAFQKGKFTEFKQEHSMKTYKVPKDFLPQTKVQPVSHVLVDSQLLIDGIQQQAQRTPMARENTPSMSAAHSPQETRPCRRVTKQVLCESKPCGCLG